MAKSINLKAIRIQTYYYQISILKTLNIQSAECQIKYYFSIFNIKQVIKKRLNEVSFNLF